MSEDQKHDEVIAKVKQVISIVRFFGWLGAIMGATAVAGLTVIVTIAVSDHYDQIALRKESDWMLPRVSQIWYASFGNKEPTIKNIP